MQSCRSFSRSLSQTFRRRLSHQTRSFTQSSRHSNNVKYLFGASFTAAALMGCAAYHSHSSSLECEPSASAAPAASAAAPSIQESTRYVRSFLGEISPLSLDQTLDLSFDQLSALFDSHASSKGENYPHYGQHAVPLIFTSQRAVQSDDVENNAFRQSMERMLRQVQDTICQHILNLESSAASLPESINQSSTALHYNRTTDPSSSEQMCFREDVTMRGDGGGIARVFQGGLVFEKAGVNVSVANVRLPFHRLADQSEDHAEIAKFVAMNQFNVKQAAKTGDQSIPVIESNTIVERFTASLSLVIHPKNPHCPTSHANYRFFAFKIPVNQTNPSDDKYRTIYWFAGGSDLTPAYVNDEDASYFHRTLKNCCDRHDPTYYSRFKKWCDRYFTIYHRGETRGVGGIFLDDVSLTNEQTNNRDMQLNEQQAQQKYFNFITDCAQTFSKAYFPIIAKRAATPFTRQQKEWQLYRRSRYVEFNLMYDKGTSFGLAQANSRPEAILMSLPLNCSFQYKPLICPGSEEERTMNILKTPVEWV